jgi:hypothetical protein
MGIVYSLTIMSTDSGNKNVMLFLKEEIKLLMYYLEHIHLLKC